MHPLIAFMAGVTATAVAAVVIHLWTTAGLRMDREIARTQGDGERFDHIDRLRKLPAVTRADSVLITPPDGVPMLAGLTDHTDVAGADQ